jgi:hypothetical protein
MKKAEKYSIALSANFRFSEFKKRGLHLNIISSQYKIRVISLVQLFRVNTVQSLK